MLFSAPVQAQDSLNVSLLSHLNQYASVGYNDIWGYVDPQGREYALLGTDSGTSIVDITNPTQAVEVAFIPGANSIWRDIKTSGHYMYAVSEGGLGLQIVDLSDLPNSATLITNFTNYFTTAHNLFIDNGYAFVVGANNGSGIHILDLSDPTNPVQTSNYNTLGYIHDLFVWNDTLIACTGYTQNYAMLDISDKSNPVIISQSASLPGIYAHSGWMTEDKRYFLACEEFDVRDLTVWDLQDRSTWDLVVSSWQMPESTPIHNVFVKGNYAHISYYKDGYVVLDISDPTNPQLAGWYDTYPSPSGTYEGAWGCYPFFPSGTVIISDINTGLYVFDFLLDNNTPVELNSFTFTVNSSSITLNWSTATETNNRGFELERSLDNIKWNKIAFIEGKGNSSVPVDYSFTDKFPLQGKSYYKLVQTDFNGDHKSYSSVEVNYSGPQQYSLKQNYPNPFNPSTKIEFSIPQSGNVNISVFNMLGQKVKELINKNLNAGNHSVTFDAKTLSSGIYIARINSGGFTKNIKMNLIK